MYVGTVDCARTNHWGTWSSNALQHLHPTRVASNKQTKTHTYQWRHWTHLSWDISYVLYKSGKYVPGSMVSWMYCPLPIWYPVDTVQQFFIFNEKQWKWHRSPHKRQIQTLWRCTISATALISMTFRVGFVGVSIHTIWRQQEKQINHVNEYCYRRWAKTFVLLCIAFSTLLASVASTKLVWMLKLEITLWK